MFLSSVGDQDWFYGTFYLSFFIVLSLLNTLVFHEIYFKTCIWWSMLCHACLVLPIIMIVFIIVEEHYRTSFHEKHTSMVYRYIALPWIIFLYNAYSDSMSILYSIFFFMFFLVQTEIHNRCIGAKLFIIVLIIFLCHLDTRAAIFSLYNTFPHLSN